MPNQVGKARASRWARAGRAWPSATKSRNGTRPTSHRRIWPVLASMARSTSYGPTLKAFEAADDGRDALAADLANLARRRDRNHDGGSIAIPASYLETVLTLR